MKRAKRKVLYVSAADGAYGDSGYRFDVVMKNGVHRRVHPNDCLSGEEVCQPFAVLSKWLRAMRITHVNSKLGNTDPTTPECIKDGTYPVTRYLAWWRQCEMR